MPISILEPATLILAHGAGAPMDSPFLETIARGVEKAGVRVVRFEFPYMAERRATGRRRPPDRQGRLLDTWREVVAQVGAPETRFIGGKSLGGRMASMVADELGVRGLVVLGYPFHPPRKPETLRTEHLRDLRTPTLIVQGERDTLGSRAEVEQYELSAAITIHWLDDGDHSFKPRVRSGATEAGNLDRAIAATVAFVAGR
jgi:predicted alpha/beta-hydrolase family hydrolase